MIAATGLGKTYLAAFDFVQSKMSNLLFVAHRETIISKAAEAYRKLLRDQSFGHILTGSTGQEQYEQMLAPGASVFAMVPSMVSGSKYMQFARNHFDYIVVDEFHHSAANSYQKLLDWFRPKFLLGLTATPERMDGRDVLANCDYDVSYEIRLFDAIDRQLLVPFQYFAIFDPTDYKSIRWTGFGYDEAELDQALIDDTRAELIINNLRKFLPSTGKIKALAFCSSRAHAKYMAKKLKAAAFESVSLLGDDDDATRKRAIDDLQDENHPLEVICSVDIFGEGVDIPAVSHVLLLRPTLSLTVFLQQLGRGLRLTPDKQFLVCLDFVGNFRNSYLVPLFFQGLHSPADYKSSKKPLTEFSPPRGCYISASTEVQRVWDNEIRRVLRPANRKETLGLLYDEMRSELQRSPAIMDFFANPTAHDPYVFIKEFDGWLRAKENFNDLTAYEKDLLDTPGELFLKHLEKDLHPTRSYKMVVLNILLNTPSDQYEWHVNDIAANFKDYYLANRQYLHDYQEMAAHPDPASFPIEKVVRKLLDMPLNYLSNKKDDFFTLDRLAGTFTLTSVVRPFWSQPSYRSLLMDRILFGIKRYFFKSKTQRGKRIKYF